MVRSSHSVQGNPQAIEEIRRILLEHAAVPEKVARVECARAPATPPQNLTERGLATPLIE